MTVGIRPTAACSWSMLCIALRGLSFSVSCCPFRSARELRWIQTDTVFYLCCLLCWMQLQFVHFSPSIPIGASSTCMCLVVCSPYMYARTHAHARTHTHLLSPSQGRRTRQQLCTQNATQSKKGQYAHQGFLFRRTTTPIHHKRTRTHTRSVFTPGLRQEVRRCC